MMKAIAILLAAATTSACSVTPFAALKQSYVSVVDSNRETVGSIFIWSNDVNAAVVYKSGVVCAQRAMTVVTADSRIQAAVPDSIFKLSEAAAATAAASVRSEEAAADAPDAGAAAQTASQTARSAALVELAASIQEAAQLLTTTTERTAFLDVGMFYLCQLSNNRSISEADARALTGLLIEVAGGLGGPSSSAVATVPPVAQEERRDPLTPVPPVGPAGLRQPALSEQTGQSGQPSGGGR